ncbi:MAG TPA: hypothetical protein VFQ35_16285 [Polyangiaceae bacterium]|nr:hypothetical protein [Polyangiaceae bacterium]
MTVLLAALATVLVYAWRDRAARVERTRFERTLNVAVVIVEAAPVAANALTALRGRTRALEDRLASEFHRYRPDGPRPFGLVVFGPVSQVLPPPSHLEPSALGLAKRAWELLRFTRDVDARAHVPTRGFDTRLYMVVRPPANASRAFVEGASEQGGRVGIALVELDDTMADFALFVGAHELFHTLGATDKVRHRRPYALSRRARGTRPRAPVAAAVRRFDG